MNVFEKVTESPEALASLLRAIPAIETPWDDAFHRLYCSSCAAADCDDCRRPERDKLDKTTAGSAAARDWYFTEKTVDNLVEFTRALMEKYNIPAENVVRHYDVTGKWCPRPWMGDDMNAYYGTSGNEQWARFKARLSGNEEVFDMDINEARKQLTSCADTGDTPSAWAKEAAEYCKRKGIFNGDGAGNFGWQQPITREAVACIIYRALEAAGALGNLSDV